MAKTFLTSAGVAELLEIPKQRFLKKRAELEEFHQFPTPMPHAQRPMLWRRDEVLAWVRRNGNPVTPDLPAILPSAGGNVVIFQKAQTA